VLPLQGKLAGFFQAAMLDLAAFSFAKTGGIAERLAHDNPGSAAVHLLICGLTLSPLSAQW
jgi:hypothetical protein